MSNISVNVKNVLGRPEWRGPTPLESVVSAARRWWHNRTIAARPVEDHVGQAAREAEALRAYARNFEKSDRGFAADLYAAANRHETLGDACPRSRSTENVN